MVTAAERFAAKWVPGRQRSCVNPAHLEPVTRQVNARRGEGGAHNAAKTHCLTGHGFSHENTRRNLSGWRRCLTCNRDRSRAYRARQRAA